MPDCGSVLEVRSKPLHQREREEQGLLADPQSWSRDKSLRDLERAKGFEPSTPTLARLCSTPELRPLDMAEPMRDADRLR